MRSGGQVSPNQGVDFAAPSGLQGVTQDPRDMGYPQVSFGGLFSAIGDPTSFVSRENRSFELYDNVMLDRGNHHFKFGGYLFHLEFNPVNPTNAQRATSHSTASGRATRSPTSCSAIRASSQVGIGRADEHGRSTWLHVYAQDDWKVRSNLTFNYGLRYEINSQMADVDNRLSAIDLPGRRFVIASDDDGSLSPTRSRCCRRFRLPYVTSKDAGWTRGLLRPSYLRFAPRVGIVWATGDDGRTVVNAGFGVFLNQWAYSVQQALAQTLPFFFAKTVTAAADAVQPTQQHVRPCCWRRRTAPSAATRWTGTSGPSTRRTTRSSVQRQVGVDDDGRGELPAIGDRRRRQLHGAQRAGAGPGRDWAAPAGSASWPTSPRFGGMAIRSSTA